MAGRTNIREEVLMHVARRARLDGTYMMFMVISAVWPRWPC